MSPQHPDTSAAEPLQLTLDHAGVSVDDIARSTRFYRDVLGFEVEEEFQIPGTSVRGAVLVNRGGARVELFHRDDSQRAPAGHPIESTQQQGWFQIAFCVTDVATVFDRVVEAGASPVKEPFVAPDGHTHVAFIGDPDGNLIELIQRATN